MQTARETKLDLIRRLADKGVTLGETEVAVYLDEDGTWAPSVYVLACWSDGTALAQFAWPWSAQAFSSEDYETYFSRG